ncbi:MAG TPA: hypothetical protein VJV03_14790 [Pyrinomonadaceae bacterium]|nr:hypothetical protein [Pyrinomonadaceae bacterium]
MADSVVTVRDVFDLPHPGSPEESGARWQSLRQWMNEELPDTKSSTMDDIGARIEQLLEIPLRDIFVASWKETDAIKDLLAESRTAPAAITNVELADHSIKSLHHPHIEVRQKKATSKKIEFTLRLLFKLQGFRLRIQNGLIKEVRSGRCEMQGTLEYQGLTVAEQKNVPISLPAVIATGDARKADVAKPEPVPVSIQKPPEPKQVEKAGHSPVSEQEPSPDAASFIPPTKITPKINEGVAATTDVASPSEPQPEEDREVLVL